MSTLDQILGRSSVTEDSGDVPPVIAGRTRPASMLRKQPKDKEEKKLRDKARQASVVASIIGVAESDGESIIPDDAKQVDPFSNSQIPGMTAQPSLDAASPSEPSLANGKGEELIPPTAALVAPDVTPKVFQMIDPGQVPAPPKPTVTPPGPPTVGPATAPEKGALDTILGRQNPAPEQTELPPVAVESFLHTINPVEVKSAVAQKLVPASQGGSSMPEHKQGDGRAILEAFRTFTG